MILPNKWQIIPLEELAEVRSGVTLSQKVILDGVELPYLRVANVQDGKIDLTEIKNVTVEKNKVERFLLKKGDILLTEGGDFDKLGRGAVWQGEIEPCLHQNHVFAVRIKGKLLPEFFAALTRTHHGRTYFLSCAKRSTNLASINSSQLKRFPVILPPLAEQKKIAEILSTWDEAISAVDKQLENCRLQKKALMQQLLTGKNRLPGFSGEWKAKRLSSFCKRITERNNGHCSLVATISAQYGLIRQEEFFNKSVASETLDNYFLLRKGDFAYNKSYSLGYPMGAIKRLNRYQEAVVTSLYICFRLDETKADSDYFEFFFDSGLLDKSLTQIAAEGGRAHGLLNVRPDDFMGIQILFPPLEEQKAIASVLSTSARQIEMLEQKLNALQEEKKSLMQQLLTGKKRVAV